MIGPHNILYRFISVAANGSQFLGNWGENYAGSSGLPTKQRKKVHPEANVEVSNGKTFKRFHTFTFSVSRLCMVEWLVKLKVQIKFLLRMFNAYSFRP